MADPGDFGGIGSLYVFYGPASSDPLPPPEAADAVIQFDADGLLDTGWRLKQACDYTFDDIADIYVGATILREDGTTADRVLIVTPVSWRVITDVRSDPSLPDFWQSFDGSECENNEWIKTVLRDWGYELMGDDDDDSSSSSSESNLGILNVVDYALVLFDFNPQQWANNIAEFVAISASAREAARGAFPIDRDTMSDAEIESQQWKRNAMRHALWQGSLAYRFGTNAAKEIGDIHERGEEGLDTWIDQYNNQVARNIVAQCIIDGCTLEELIRRLLEALDDGRFIRSPCDTRVPPTLRPDSCPDDEEPAPVGDVNSDGLINMDDLIVTVGELGQEFPTADLNANGVVDPLDIVDLVLIIEDNQ